MMLSHRPSTALRLVGVAALASTLLGCPEEDETVTWETARENLNAPVTGPATTYQPPAVIDLNAVRQEQARNAANSFPTAANLAGTSWTLAEPPLGEPKRLQFLPKMLLTTSAEGQVDTLLADYTGAQPGCIGNPMCVITLNKNNVVAVNFPYTEGEKLWFAACAEWAEPVPSDEEIREKNQVVVVYRKERILCTVGANQAPYLLDAGG